MDQPSPAELVRLSDVADKVFIVFEVDVERQGQAGASAPRSTPKLVGCYAADDASSACQMASAQLGRPCVLAAVKAALNELTFCARPVTPSEFEQAGKVLQKSKEPIDFPSALEETRKKAATDAPDHSH